MDALEADLAALAATPAPAGLARLERALMFRVLARDPASGWPLRTGLAATALAMGIAIGLQPAPPATDPLYVLLLQGDHQLLPSSLLATRL
jgi:hypothetical protein